MANLTLCVGELSKTPYYIVSLGVNVYSMEELCYALFGNVYVLDIDIMDDELVAFIREQLNNPDLADELALIVKEKRSLGDFIVAILSDIAYCPEDELKRIKQILLDNAGLGYARKRKARGDNMLKSQKYSLAIDEYQYILQNIESDDEPELYAAILHNIGTAYARLFLFEKAASYYKEAYQIKGERESRIQYLMALRLTMRREQYERLLLRFGYEEDIVEEAERRMDVSQASKPESAAYERYKEVKRLQERGRVAEYYRAVDITLNEWKQEYRKNMIVRNA